MSAFIRRLDDARTYLASNGIDAWLLVDFQQNNPIFWQLLGERRHTTRRAYLSIAADGAARFLLHHVDANRLADLGLPIDTYRSYDEQIAGLTALLAGRRRVAMEYSPMGVLPVASRVDAGTVDLVRSLNVEIVPSADVLQAVVARWTDDQLASHRRAVSTLTRLREELFERLRSHVSVGITEYDAVQFLTRRFEEEGLITADPPTVAVNEHSADPHYEPSAAASAPIRAGDWVLVDWWAKERDLPNAVYGDMTWVAFVGDRVPAEYQRVFDVVRTARDVAVGFLEDAWAAGRSITGWEVDRAAREVIEREGYGQYFTHRLGHSLGEQVHGSGVNLDSFETRDTRRIIPGVAFSVEPGVYLPEFGVRLEIDVYQSADGPEVTTPIQREIILLG